MEPAAAEEMAEFDEIAEPYRFNFEISMEVANKGEKDTLLELLIGCKGC